MFFKPLVPGFTWAGYHFFCFLSIFSAESSLGPAALQGPLGLPCRPRPGGTGVVSSTAIENHITRSFSGFVTAYFWLL